MDEESLFAAAREMRDPAERRAFLAQACRDDAALQERLQRLLEADQCQSGILEGLRQGRVDRELFTSDANAYFNDVVLQDFAAALDALGKLQAVIKTNQQLRGGMTHRSYRAQFEKKTVLLNIYLTTDGQYEQFLVEQSL